MNFPVERENQIYIQNYQRCDISPMFEVKVTKFSVDCGKNSEKISAMWETVAIFIYIQVVGLFREQMLLSSKLCTLAKKGARTKVVQH